MCCIICNLCGSIKCHPQCPNYIPPKAAYYCSTCGQGIYPDEEYIENEDGEYKHYDCICGTRELLEWLGYKVKTMEEYYAINS